MRNLTILVAPIPAVGHVNACIGAMKNLRARGHRIIFVVDDTYEGKIKIHGYEEFIYPSRGNPLENEKGEDAREDSATGAITFEKLNPGEELAKKLLKSKIIGPFTPLEKLQLMNETLIYDKSLKIQRIRFDFGIKAAIEYSKPDLIYHDGLQVLPAIYYSEIPWILQFSTTPIYPIVDPDLPPGGSGKLLLRFRIFG